MPGKSSHFRRRLRRGFYIYLGIALLGLGTSKHEIFPFFAWTLFPVTPAKVTAYQLRIPEKKDFFMPPPSAGNPIDFYNAVQRLGEGLREGKEDTVEREQRFLEKNYLPSGVSFEVLELQMDPGQYYRSGDAKIEVLSQISPEPGPATNPSPVAR